VGMQLKRYAALREQNTKKEAYQIEKEKPV